MSRISLYIIDDHKVLIDGLELLLSGHSSIDIIGKNTDPVKAVEEIKRLKPAVVLTDIQMPGMSGVELSKNLKRLMPDIKIIALSMFGDSLHIRDMLSAGVSGYLLKNSDKHELVTAIETVNSGKVYYSEAVKDEITRQEQRENDPDKPRITTREREIIQLIAKECSNAQIAEKLFISERTVETHRKNIFRKTNTKSVVGLLKFAMENNLL